MLRTRVATIPCPSGQVGISYATFDAIAGWAPTFGSKILAEPPMRQVGLDSLFVALQSVALKITVHHDPEQYEIIKNRLKGRDATRVHPGGKQKRKLMEISPDFMRLISAMGNQARSQKLSPERRQEIARHAALARHHPNKVKAKPRKKLHQAVFVKKR